MIPKIALFTLLLAVLCGCATRQNSGQSLTTIPGKTKEIKTRNNAASLLADLLKQEKDVAKVFILKKANKPVVDLVTLIGATAATHERELLEMSTNDPSLKLNAIRLPPGELAARDGTTKSKERDLLLTSGHNFEFNLLFSQAQAENYGWHLAAVAADNSSNSEEEHTFTTIGQTMEHLYRETVEQMRALPAE
jgi:hypothetical protein